MFYFIWIEHIEIIPKQTWIIPGLYLQIVKQYLPLFLLLAYIILYEHIETDDNWNNGCRLFDWNVLLNKQIVYKVPDVVFLRLPFFKCSKSRWIHFLKFARHHLFPSERTKSPLSIYRKYLNHASALITPMLLHKSITNPIHINILVLAFYLFSCFRLFLFI